MNARTYAPQEKETMCFSSQRSAQRKGPVKDATDKEDVVVAAICVTLVEEETEEGAIWGRLQRQALGNKTRFRFECCKKLLQQQYGCLVDLSKLLWANIENYFNKIGPRTCLIGRQNTMACQYF